MDSCVYGCFAVEDGVCYSGVNFAVVGSDIDNLWYYWRRGRFACLARFNGEPLFIKDVVSCPMRVRVVFEIIGRLSYGLANTFIICDGDPGGNTISCSCRGCIGIP